MGEEMFLSIVPSDLVEHNVVFGVPRLIETYVYLCGRFTRKLQVTFAETKSTSILMRYKRRCVTRTRFSADFHFFTKLSYIVSITPIIVQYH